jgi:glycosyltransferase involved in cell wall biosynthesis
LVIGSGKDKKRLQKLAGPTIRLLENVSDVELVEYYRGARALLMPQEEDLGLVALEAQACGSPVISYRYSGAAEVIIDGTTGALFDHQTVDDLTAAMKRCPTGGKACTIQANRFSKTKFQKDFREMVEEVWRTTRTR